MACIAQYETKNNWRGKAWHQIQLLSRKKNAHYDAKTVGRDDIKMRRKKWKCKYVPWWFFSRVSASFLLFDNNWVWASKSNL